MGREASDVAGDVAENFAGDIAGIVAGVADFVAGPVAADSPCVGCRVPGLIFSGDPVTGATVLRASRKRGALTIFLPALPVVLPLVPNPLPSSLAGNGTWCEWVAGGVAGILAGHMAGVTAVSGMDELVAVFAAISV